MKRSRLSRRLMSIIMTAIFSSLASRPLFVVASSRAAFVSMPAASRSSWWIGAAEHNFNGGGGGGGSCIMLLDSNRARGEGDAENDEKQPGNNNVEATWTYTPYNPNASVRNRPTTGAAQRRTFSTWIVPKVISVPEDRLEISFVRSSGAGGQNVNKLSTKVDLRFCVDDADWIPSEVRQRLKEQQANRINKEGFLSLQSQEYRTQAQNKKDAISKLKEMLLAAWPRPKIRKQRKGPSKAAKERNKEFKKKRSETKARRGRVDF